MSRPLTPEERADLRDEFEPRRKRRYRCSDRMCGAEDCENCHPEAFGPKGRFGGGEDEKDDE